MTSSLIFFFLLYFVPLCFFFFFFNDTATTEIYTLSLHDALPIWDCLPLLHLDLGQHARRGRRNLGVHLVGRDLEQRLVPLHFVTQLLEPLAQGPLGDGLAHLGHDNVNPSHTLSSRRQPSDSKRQP